MLGPESAFSIASTLSQNQSLTALDVSCNNIDEPSSISLSLLTYVLLTHSCAGGRSIVEAIVANPRVVVVDARFNQIAAADMERLEEVLKQRQNAKGINMGEVFDKIV